MKKNFLILSVTVVSLSVLFAMCIKEYSDESGPAAKFTIEGTPGMCAPVNISGAYTTEIALDSNNYATITADVSRAGKYTISTSAADGISFSASGVFTDTGKQVVYLRANGTPATEGSFTIIIPGDNGCSFNLVVKKKAPAAYVLSGNPVDCSNPVVQGSYTQSMRLTNKEKIELSVDVTTPGTYAINAEANGILFSDSGYFSATGNQLVTLSGSGTPGEAGLFYFPVQADSSQCSFSIPVTPASPLAVYVLEYSQDTVCTQYSINGTYVSGVPLNNTNTVSFSVYVTDVGNYSIYTKKSNGIMFGSSGKFSQAGEQTIVLTGSGTPSSSGIFVVSPEIVGPSPRGGNFCDLTIRVQ